MLHVFIDTNILLRFYAYSDDTLAEVEKLSALVKAGKIKLLVTQQVVDERARNRDRELSESMKRLEQLGASVQIPRFAEHHVSAAKFSAAMKEAKAAKTELLAAIKDEIAEEGLKADQIIQKMFDASNILERTVDVVKKASLRRELANPPGKKDSLGDQINWEIMLDSVPEKTDLHVISKDGDYKGSVIDGQANFFLKEEWRQRKNANLYVHAGLSEFAKAHFPEIKVPSDAIKSAAITNLVSSKSFAQTHSAIADLNSLVSDLSTAEALSLLTAITENSQISGIITDSDVKKFYEELHNLHIFSTSVELDNKLAEVSEEVFGSPF